MKHPFFPDTYLNPTRVELEESGLFAPIAYDMDGVLMEGDGLRDYIAKKFNTTPQEMSGVAQHGYETFNFYMPGVDFYKDVMPEIDHYIGKLSLDDKPTPYMVESLEAVYNATKTPAVIVTARSLNNVETTFEWLDKNLPSRIPFVLIMVHGVAKQDVLKPILNRMFIDDRYKTIKTLEDHIPCPVLYQRPWNQGRPESAGVAEVSNLWGLITLLQHNFF